MAGSMKAFDMLSSSGSKSSLGSSLNSHRTQQTTEYGDYDFPPDRYESNIYDLPPDANRTHPSVYVQNDYPLDDSFDECSDSDDEPEAMKRKASFGKSTLRRISKLVKKNHSVDVPLIGDTSGHSKTKSFGSIHPHSVQKTSTISHTAVQHTSNEYTNVPLKMRAGKSNSSPYINWAMTGNFTASQ